MKQRKSLHVQRGSISVMDAAVATALVGSLALTVYGVKQESPKNCMEWRQDLYDTREICQQDHPRYLCLDRDPVTNKWLGTTYAKNVCSNGTSHGGSGGGGGAGSYSNAADSPNASRSISRGGFGGGHGSGGG